MTYRLLHLTRRKLLTLYYKEVMTYDGKAPYLSRVSRTSEEAQAKAAEQDTDND